jgi:dTDP-4-dehydrorhamnose 3,5-epimerase
LQEVPQSKLAGVRLIRRGVHRDARGTFEVLWSDAAADPNVGRFVQDNLIVTHRGTLRGMHFQSLQPQGKLLTVLEGEVFDAAVDLRPGSPTYGQSEGFILRSDERQSLWLPPGMAHGFMALSDRVVYHYKVTAPWDPDAAHVLAWDDRQAAIDWPLAAGEWPELSERDAVGLSWVEVRRIVEH